MKQHPLVGLVTSKERTLLVMHSNPRFNLILVFLKPEEICKKETGSDRTNIFYFTRVAKFVRTRIEGSILCSQE